MSRAIPALGPVPEGRAAGSAAQPLAEGCSGDTRPPRSRSLPEAGFRQGA